MYKNKKIAVVIPAYNEETQIKQVIQTIPSYIDFIVVIDDGSTDNTGIISNKEGAIVVTHAGKNGVGAAFKSGLIKVLELRADIMVNIDADGQFNPCDITKLIEPIISGKANFVTASRFLNKEFYPKMPRIKFIGNKIMSFFISKISNHKFYDVSCGFRAYSREAILRLNLFGDFTYTQETFLDFTFKNISIIEIPVKVLGSREHGKSKVASNLFKYAYRSLKIILKTFRDYKPFKLFSIISFILFTLGTLNGCVLIFNYINSGKFTPHKWAGFVSGFFFLLGITLINIGFILDSFSRMRHNQEEMLYYLKKKSYYGDKE